MVFADAVSEAGENEGPLVGLEIVEEWVSDDVAFVEVLLEDFESAVVLGVG